MKRRPTDVRRQAEFWFERRCSGPCREWKPETKEFFRVKSNHATKSVQPCCIVCKRISDREAWRTKHQVSKGLDFSPLLEAFAYPSSWKGASHATTK